ncbi:MAG TPA: DoxX family protein [Gemmatimonas sp.]|uniref:DoxX family protein n=1 Tax=Gemmatimonas sp. TaxID=1962908 RepID=UPI002ED92BD8
MSFASHATPARPLAPLRLWGARIMQGIVVLFLAFDGIYKLIASPEAADATVQLGYPAGVLTSLGALEMVLLLIYLVPRTAPIGAVLWTGYLGGAIATHVRVGNPLFSHVLFPIYVAVLLWGALYLRDRRVQALVQSAGSH